MIIPWKTDAPVYHVPYGTIGLIVLNTLIFFLVPSDSEQLIPWMLQFGDGLHPLQWVSNNFLHADLFHLLGNMVFLWLFGLIVEGKIGWWRFLLIYVGLGVVESASVQICMQHQSGMALGASGAIFGLLAMSLVWAPLNEVSCVVFVLFRPFTFDVPVLTFAGLYLLWELFVAWMSDFRISSEMLHLAGAVPGFVVALLMLKLDLVDCESYDLLSVIRGKDGKSLPPPPPLSPAEQTEKLSARRNAASAHLQNHLSTGNVQEALALYKRIRESDPDWHPPPQDLLRLAKLFHTYQLWPESVAPLVEYLQTAPNPAPRVRLSLAQILLDHEKRPNQAARVLARLSPAELTPELAQVRDRLLARAKKLSAQGELELATEDW